jgi:hypothetical protein
MLSQAPTQPDSDQSTVAHFGIAESAELSSINVCHKETMTSLTLLAPDLELR